MAQDVCVLVTADDRARLAAIAGDGSRPYKHVLRARIILHSADCLPVQEVARRAGVSPSGGLALATPLRMQDDRHCPGNERPTQILIILLDIRPRRSLTPVEFCRGTSPIQAASSLPDLTVSVAPADRYRGLRDPA